MNCHLLKFMLLATMALNPIFAAEIQPPIGFTSVQTRGTPELSPNARLRKLSLHLRGLTPDPSEYSTLEDALKKNGTEAFFKSKTTEYLASPRHLGKMTGRIDELLRLRLSSGLPESRHVGLGSPGLNPSNPGYEDYNSLGFIIEEIVTKNLSWDTLLTGKSFKVEVPAPQPFSRPSDVAFFKPIAPELPGENTPTGPITVTPLPSTTPTKLIDVPLKSDDNRVAGVVTTSRFFSRYSTTNLNKSRGRAAAIFRTFLCDDMRATVEPKPEEEEELLKNAFPKPTRRRDAWHFSNIDDDPHGAQPACMACHYKLDPLGKTFINFGNVMATEASPGALVYKKENGTEVNEKGNGLGEVLAFITQQDEYKRCQVKHFWKWFVRGDQPPNEARLNELVEVFDSLGRRPNDFISYLVNEPEFRVHPDSVTTDLYLSQVSATLSRCDQCHTGVSSSTIPSFVKFPIGNSEQNHREYLKEIAEKLDLKNGGLNKKMPPKSSPWQPTAGELLSIKDWIRQGAKDSSGKPTIEEDFAISLVGGTLPPGKKGSFQDSYVHYISTHDFIRRLRQSFPDAVKAEDFQCLSLRDDNRMLLGEPNPATGELAYPGPSLAYVKYFGLCLTKAISKDLWEAEKVSGGLHRVFGRTAVMALKMSPQAAVLDKPRTVPWIEISSEIQTSIASHLVASLIGPKILKNEEAYIQRLVQVVARDSSVKTAYDALSKFMFFIGTQDEFLSY